MEESIEGFENHAARSHKLWPEFESWAVSEDVDTSELSSIDDWKPWWECFLSGAIAEMRLHEGEMKR